MCVSELSLDKAEQSDTIFAILVKDMIRIWLRVIQEFLGCDGH